MILQKRVLLWSAAGVTLAAMVQPAAAAPWERGFVVATYEYAFRYGGRAGFTKAGEIEPGSDCLHGSTVHFANDKNTEAAIRQPFRSQYEIEVIARPPGLDHVRSPDNTRFHIWNRAIAYRAWKRGIQTYVNPWAAEDPGQPEVTGKIATGFNLDNNPDTGGFVAEDGEKGIDHALYRAWGCYAPWRGDVAADYSYRIVKSEQYTKLKSRIRNGVVETQQVETLHAPRLAWFYDHAGDADFRKGRIRLVIGENGDATGLIGGYRNWREIYTENTFAQDGGQQGIREHEDHIALYYAMKRNADGMPDPATGEKMGISSTYRITAKPAYVVDAQKPVGVTVIAAEEARKDAFLAIRANTIKSTLTRTVQDVPPGTTEASFPTLERVIQLLPSKAYYLTILDRPRYPDEAETIERAIKGTLPVAAPAPPPDKQVRNEGAAGRVADARRP